MPKVPQLFKDDDKQAYLQSIGDSLEKRVPHLEITTTGEPLDTVALGCYDASCDYVRINKQSLGRTINSYCDADSPNRAEFAMLSAAYVLAHEVTHAEHLRKTWKTRPQITNEHAEIYQLIQDIPYALREKIMLNTVPMDHYLDMPEAMKQTPLGKRMTQRVSYLAANVQTLKDYHNLTNRPFLKAPSREVGDAECYAGMEFIAHMGAMRTLIEHTQKHGVQNDCDRAIVTSATHLKEIFESLDPKERIALERVVDYIECGFVQYKKPNPRVVGHMVPSEVAMEIC